MEHAQGKNRANRQMDLPPLGDFKRSLIDCTLGEYNKIIAKQGNNNATKTALLQKLRTFYKKETHE